MVLSSTLANYEVVLVEVFWLIVLVLVVWPLMAAANKQHKDATGVNAPTRSQLKNIRRQARQKGLSEEAAYYAWLQRKQKNQYNQIIGVKKSRRTGGSFSSEMKRGRSR